MENSIGSVVIDKNNLLIYIIGQEQKHISWNKNSKLLHSLTLKIFQKCLCVLFRVGMKYGKGAKSYNLQKRNLKG